MVGGRCIWTSRLFYIPECSSEQLCFTVWLNKGAYAGKKWNWKDHQLNVYNKEIMRPIFELGHDKISRKCSILTAYHRV